MPLALIYLDTAKRQIGEYLAGIDDAVVHAAAIEELRRELQKIAANPVGGLAPTGPFETRPTFRFYLESGDRRRLASVLCVVSKEHLTIELFSAVPV